MIINTRLEKLNLENLTPIHAFLTDLSNQKNLINSFLGRPISILFDGKITCSSCQKSIKKTFGEGYCYPCFISVPESSPCVIRPELCEAHLGKGRDLDWEKKYHLQPHTVYLSLTSGLKVGVTRAGHDITRWMDQGAVAAIRLAETPNRYLAGCIEVALKDYVSDRTSLQKMLKHQIPDIDLLSESKRLSQLLPHDFQAYCVSEPKITTLTYPIGTPPEKVRSITLDKVPEFTSVLTGMKGQYLIFKDGVFNVRRHTGYHVTLTIN